MSRPLAAPDDILEELVDRVVLTIARSADIAFDRSLDELEDYHHFLLGISSVEADDGSAQSYAEIAGNDWTRPYQAWTRRYRRLLETAASKLRSETRFYERVFGIPLRLLANRRSLRLSKSITDDIPNFGIMAMYRLEAQLQFEQEQATRTSPDSPFASSYRRLLMELVGTWETLLQISRTEFSLPDEDGPQPADGVTWRRYSDCWSFLWAHLTATAHCLAVAAWNGDGQGAGIFAESLKRWATTLDYSATAAAYVPWRRLLYPTLFEHDWAAAKTQADLVVGNLFSVDHPRQLFQTILLGAHEDVIQLTAQLLLRWVKRGVRSTAVVSQVALSLLRPWTEHEDNPNAEQTNALGPLLIGIRQDAIDMGRRDGSYSSSLDQLIREIDQMTERPIVPGRVYTPSTISDRDELIAERVALLVSGAKEADIARSEETAARLTKKESALPEGDGSLRALLRQLGRMNDAANGPNALSDLESILSASASALEPNLSIVRTLLAGVQRIIASERHSTLLSRQIDTAHLERIRLAIQADFMQAKPRSFFSEVAATLETPEPNVPPRTWSLTGVSRDEFVLPPMSSSPDALDEHLVKSASTWLDQQIWRDFTRQGRKAVESQADVSSEAFWVLIGDFKQSVGDKPVLVVSMAAEDEAVRALVRNPPSYLEVTKREQGERAKVGRYLGTLNGVDVYGVEFPAGIAWLFSADVLSEFRLGSMTPPENFVNVFFAPDGADETKGAIRLEFYLRTAWDKSRTIYEINLPKATGKTELNR